MLTYETIATVPDAGEDAPEVMAGDLPDDVLLYTLPSRRAGHITIATGRDYADVAPTSGSYVGEANGRLTAQRRVGVVTAAA